MEMGEEMKILVIARTPGEAKNAIARMIDYTAGHMTTADFTVFANVDDIRAAHVGQAMAFILDGANLRSDWRELNELLMIKGVWCFHEDDRMRYVYKQNMIEGKPK